MSSDNEEDSPELAARRARASLAHVGSRVDGAPEKQPREARCSVATGSALEPIKLLHAQMRAKKLIQIEADHAKQMRDEWRTIGEWMRQYREESGVSLRWLAEEMGVSPPFLSDMERGNRRYTLPHIDRALAICPHANDLIQSSPNSTGQPRAENQ
jgi:DNA-binding XRE family transcriptional regulator